MFESEAQERLLAIARRALEARVRRTAPPSVDTRAPLDATRGAFVSIHRGAALRGCLGRISADRAVARVVARLAEAVSDSDPRFAPVTADELPGLDIEISILTPERQVERVGEIEVGRHGVIVDGGGRRGLLLPQVAMAHGWDAATFLAHTCLKAGLPPGPWEHGARVFVFEAHVFGERDSGTERR